jgi:hypothetical protein
MNKKTLILVVLIALLIIGGSIWFVFFNNSSTTNSPAIIGTGSPFGQGSTDIPFGNNTNNNTNASSTGVGSNGQPVANLFEVSNEPVAGMISFEKKSVGLVIRFVDRATGHIYDVNPVTLEKTQITNNTFPKIQEAYFKNDGSSVLLRYLQNDTDSIQNLSLILTAPKSTSTGEMYSVSSVALQGNAGGVSVGPNNSLVMASKDNGSIITLGFDGSKNTNVFTSAFTDWNISWPTTSLIEITTKASASIPGYAYDLNSTSGSMTKILGPLNALTSIQSTDGKRVAYSYNLNGKSVFAYKNLSDGSGDIILPSTFADKCVWSQKSVSSIYCGTPSSIRQNEPDNWYQGITHFSDQIWKFDTVTLISLLVADPKKDFNTSVDMINPTLSPNEDYLFFINKNDLSLWALKLQ